MRRGFSKIGALLIGLLFCFFGYAVLASPGMGSLSGFGGTAPSYTASASSGHGLKLTQGVGVCYNNTTCTADIDYDGSALNLTTPTGKEFLFYVGASAALEITSGLDLILGRDLSLGSGNSLSLDLGVTDSFTYDGTDMVLNVPASKGYKLKVNNSDMMTLSSAGAAVFTASARAPTVTIGDGTGTDPVWTESSDNATLTLSSGKVLTITDGTRTLTLNGDIMKWNHTTASSARFDIGTGIIMQNGNIITSTIQATGMNAANSATSPILTSGSTYSGGPIVRSGQTLTGTSNIIEVRNNATTKFQVRQDGAPMHTSTIMGTATLVGGTVTVNTADVKTGDIIFVSRNTAGGTVGHLNAPTGSISNGNSFVINSSDAGDTSTVNWIIMDNL